MERIFLIGPPGAGKTACGQALAEKLGCQFFDTDQLIEQAESRKLSHIFSTDGEAHFRLLESRLLDELDSMKLAGQKVVFATGGGLPVYNDNLRRLKRLGNVIALYADLSVLIERVKSNADRPLLVYREAGEADKQLRNRLSDLLEQRSSVYAQAGYKIDTSCLKPDEVADEIVRILYEN